MTTETTTPEVQTLWLQSARAQGLVCHLCHETPSFEERERFFDTGLCDTCSTDTGRASPLTA
jgi:hypothetical protein